MGISRYTASHFKHALSLGLLLSVTIPEIAASYWSLTSLLRILMSVALALVWLDGILTQTGLRYGLEEANPVTRRLQKSLGGHQGLISSRLLLSGMILYIGVSIASPYPLAFMTLVFSICTISNLAAIGQLGLSNRSIPLIGRRFDRVRSSQGRGMQAAVWDSRTSVQKAVRNACY